MHTETASAQTVNAQPTATPPLTPAVVRQEKAQIALSETGVQFRNIDELYRFSQAVAQSGLAPKGMEKPEAIMVALQLGLELGLSPMSALQNIASINGRPGIYGDAALALVRKSGLLVKYSQRIEGEADNRKAIVTSQRVNEEPITSEFSVADAKRAGLWGKSGPWSQYPDRMLLFRARGFNIRDNFGDVLKGLRTTEELGDIVDVTATPVSATKAAGAKSGALSALTEAEPVTTPATPTVNETVDV